MTIVTSNKVDMEHMEQVKAEMETLGAPVVRAVFDGEIYWALEGSHRLYAAHELGIEPEIEEIEYNDEMVTIQWDGDDMEFVVSEIADMLMANRSNHILTF